MRALKTLLPDKSIAMRTCKFYAGDPITIVGSF